MYIKLIFSRCHVPACDNATTNYYENFVHFAIPNITDDDGVSYPSPCQRYESIKGQDYCGQMAFNKNKTVDCESYVWDKSEFEETVVSEVRKKYFKLFLRQLFFNFFKNIFCDIYIFLIYIYA